MHLPGEQVNAAHHALKVIFPLLTVTASYSREDALATAVRRFPPFIEIPVRQVSGARFLKPSLLSLT